MTSVAGAAHLADGVPLPVGEADLGPFLAHEGVGLLGAHAQLSHQVAYHQRRAAATSSLAVHVSHLPSRRLLCAHASQHSKKARACAQRERRTMQV